MEETDLAQRCARGDERALRQIFEAHEPSVRRLLFRVLGSLEDAEELSAETFIRFWKSAGRFRGDCSLRSYLARIALNLGRDRLRRAAKYDSALRRDYDPSNAGANQSGHGIPEAIRSGLLTLSPEDREVLTMYYLDDWTYDEMCTALDINYNALRTRLVRARKRLRASVMVEVTPQVEEVYDGR